MTWPGPKPQPLDTETGNLHKLSITSCVPQGSILGPLYFVIFISDLPEVVQESSVALYADDCKAYRVVNCPNDLIMFQDDLDRLCAWSQGNRMTFNVKKCKMMPIARKKQPFRSSLTLNRLDIEEVYEFRDLGLLMNHHLSWNSHVDAITNKANRILGLLRRTCRGWKDTKTLKMLYCTLVRSQVEYGTIVWSPHTKRNIEKLECIQQKGTKFILAKRNFTYDERLKCLNLLSLEKRCYLFDVTFLYKALNGYLKVDVFLFLNFYSRDDLYRF